VRAHVGDRFLILDWTLIANVQLLSYTFTPEDVKWFERQPGVEEVKVESEPGDLILWDSRTVHWNRAPTAEQLRVVVYVCYAPRAMATEEVLATRKRCWENRLATTHW
jgi:ectoine hydroxylase-related dioxygenase (phytanoyl-CoA dioxygenase family)